MSVPLIWLLIGFGLIFAEFVLTSFIVVFFGIAAVLVAIALWLGLPGGAIPYLLFSVLSVAMLFGLRSRFQGWFMGDTVDTASGGLDHDFIGREATVSAGFSDDEPGRGKVRFRGAAWDARSDTGVMAIDTHVRIVGRQGSVVTVEPL